MSQIRVKGIAGRRVSTFPIYIAIFISIDIVVPSVVEIGFGGLFFIGGFVPSASIAIRKASGPGYMC